MKIIIVASLILALSLGVSLVLFKDRTPSLMSGQSKTYQNERYWYKFSYPESSPLEIEASQPNIVDIAGIKVSAAFYRATSSQYAAGSPEIFNSKTWYKSTFSYGAQGRVPLQETKYYLIDNGELITLTASNPNLTVLNQILSTFEFITIPGKQRLDQKILSIKKGGVVDGFIATSDGQVNFDSGSTNADAETVSFQGQITLSGTYSLEGANLSSAIPTLSNLGEEGLEKIPQIDEIDNFPAGTSFTFRNKAFVESEFGSYRGDTSVVVENLTETFTPQFRALTADLVKVIKP